MWRSASTREATTVEAMMEDLGVIVENERDRRTLRWLIDNVGHDAIREAIQRIPGNRRPYVSNVAKVLGVTPPKSLEIADRETALRHIDAIRRQLAKKSVF